MHPKLEMIDLSSMVIRRNECTALANILRTTAKQLRTLNLCRNNIDDEGVEVLVHALASCNQLQELNLSWNRSITAIGWKKVSTLLDRPDSNLKELDLIDNNIGVEGALIFANALRGNFTLRHLNLIDNGISADGWATFSKVLCDTSTINKTYLSNHTLVTIAGIPNCPDNIQSYLRLSSVRDDKRKIAMAKILQHHTHFDVQPFFEWEFKVFPLVIAWLEKARTHTYNFGKKIRRTKLSVTYDFVREFPCYISNLLR